MELAGGKAENQSVSFVFPDNFILRELQLLTAFYCIPQRQISMQEYFKTSTPKIKVLGFIFMVTYFLSVGHRALRASLPIAPLRYSTVRSPQLCIWLLRQLEQQVLLSLTSLLSRYSGRC